MTENVLIALIAGIPAILVSLAALVKSFKTETKADEARTIAVQTRIDSVLRQSDHS
jgi:hypothetical protein